ncbi:hypothetical protein [Nakamurella endophytica]|uniref:Uncharacterized protein n=1 Tax=Nakamurella endophytica TaxID=1748367 RepID=A0A917WME8_9ACTN|nr:hypothetical protein [Nakamurella endophytica]GGM15059.1 hypothetical protein GCM10011594_38830 [Nakamurella endophytica]
METGHESARSDEPVAEAELVDEPSPTATAGTAGGAAADDIDDGIAEAEIVPTPAPGGGPTVLPPVFVPGYTEAGVPTFEYVRQRVAQRAAAAELAEGADGQGTAEDHEARERFLAQQREEAAARRLEEIRRGLGR